tara:strand:+ start:233 stop:688 length:456 start_codon:yes stop_codon:yes gene_type:complete
MPIATNSDIIDLSSENKTEELANKILKKLKSGDVVYLYGEMGVGKTTFVKYIINGFQKKNKQKKIEVTSPTFNLLNEYKIKQTKINHFDLFRLKSTEEVINLDLFANSEGAITFIEWPQMIKEKPKNLIELTFKYEKDYKKRSAKIKGLDL